MLAHKLARFLHQMAVFEGTALMAGFEIVLYSIAVLQFDLQYAYEIFTLIFFSSI